MTNGSYLRWFVLSLAVASVTSIPQLLQADTRPNILYIFTDDQSRRSVGAYEQAHDWVKTPNIDSLAASGMRFTTCYTGASCQMSRAMMMTGLLQHAIQGFDASRYPACDYDPKLQPFWPAEFRRNGYQTAAIGKWHLGEDVGHDRDWDYSVLWDRCGPGNHKAYYYNTLVRYNGGERVPLDGYSTDRYTDIAVSYLRDAAKKDKPWLLWLCYGGVHAPFTEADRHQQRYDDAPAAHVPVDIFGPRPTKPQHLVNYTTWNQDAHGAPIGFDARVKKYSRAVASLDDSVGRLVDVLRSSGQLDNTLVVYTSDQGFAWGQHGCSEKWMAYDANIAAPLIFSWPRKIDAGQVCHEPVTGVDIVSTFHSIAGVKPVVELHGRDLVPLLEDPSRTLKDPALLTHTARVYGERFLNDIKQGNFVGQGVKPAYIMMRDGPYKYIRHMQADTIEELYDLNQDPLELKNLAVDVNFETPLKQLREKAVAEVRKKNGEFVDWLPDPKVRHLP